MHLLLSKVQAKILDNKVEELLETLPPALTEGYIRLETKPLPKTIALLAQSMHILLGIACITLDFKGCYTELPLEAEELFNGKDPTDAERHKVYEALKIVLADEKIQHHDFEHLAAAFYRNLPSQKLFFRPYFILAQNVIANPPKPDKTTVERLCYGTLCLLECMVQNQLIHPGVYRPTETDELFLARYNQNRVLKIADALSSGHENHTQPSALANSLRMPCLKCGYYGAIKGDEEKDAKGKALIMAYGYYCTQCGLELFDQKDILLAGIPTILLHDTGN